MSPCLQRGLPPIRTPMASTLPVLFVGLFLGGCVTINIYFPAAAAEKAADKIIDEVWQLRQPQTPGAAPEMPPSRPGASGKPVQ